MNLLKSSHQNIFDLKKKLIKFNIQSYITNIKNKNNK